MNHGKWAHAANQDCFFPLESWMSNIYQHTAASASLTASLTPFLFCEPKLSYKIL